MKTITITTKSVGSLIKKIEKKGMYVSDYAKEIALKIPTPKNKEVINYESMTIRELGFTDYPTTTQLYEKIKEKGCELLPAITGLHMRLEDENQELGLYYVMMEPITDSGGFPHVFRVWRDGDGERWLRADWADPGDQWDLGSRVVFRLRKVTLPSDALSLERNRSVEMKAIPQCPQCYKEFAPAWDDFTQSISPYLWRPDCEHYSHNIIISIG